MDIDENEISKNHEFNNDKITIFDRKSIPIVSESLELEIQTDIYETENLNRGLISQLNCDLKSNKFSINETFEEGEIKLNQFQEILTNDVSGEKKGVPFEIEYFNQKDDGLKKNFEDRLEKLYQKYKYPDSKSTHILNGLIVPDILWKSLFSYQREGIDWLWRLHIENVGGILSDDMGLGKTVQIVSFFGCLHFNKENEADFGPILIISPATLLKVWLREFYSWWPFVRVVILHHTGSNNTFPCTFLNKRKNERYGLIILTTYGTFLKYKKQIVKIPWSYVVLDEGHKIKNPQTHINVFATQLKTPHRIIVSGTPIQNNLKELWCLMDFVYPGLLGTMQIFLNEVASHITKATYANANPLQVQTGFKCAKMLQNVIKPYLLRRTKEKVKNIIKIPDKNDYVIYCHLTTEQSNKYQKFLNDPDFLDIINGGYSQIFKGLTILRKICNHPMLTETSNEIQYSWRSSSKMLTMNFLLLDWQKNGHRSLIYSQSKKKYCIEKKFKFQRLDGNVPVSSRQSLIDQFNNDSSIFLFLLTTKVGGVGVNLIGADRVIIFDPDWNPSVDAQAKERAWRIGQTRPVVIYRLLTSGTIEEKMYNRQVFKQFLANKVLENPAHTKAKLDFGDIHELFSYSNIRTHKETKCEKQKVQKPIKKRKYKWRKNEESSDEDNFPLSCPKSKIIKKMKLVKNETGLTDFTLLSQEADQNVSEAILAMERSRPFANPKFSSNSNSLGLQVLNSLKCASLLTKNNNSQFLQRKDYAIVLSQFISSLGGCAKTKDIVDHFKRKINVGLDTITFKKILEQICEFRVDQTSKTGAWYLKKCSRLL